MQKRRTYATAKIKRGSGDNDKKFIDAVRRQGKCVTNEQQSSMTV